MIWSIGDRVFVGRPVHPGWLGEIRSAEPDARRVHVTDDRGDTQLVPIAALRPAHGVARAESCGFCGAAVFWARDERDELLVLDLTREVKYGVQLKARTGEHGLPDLPVAVNRHGDRPTRYQRHECVVDLSA